jgi:AAHS family 4-hydroxybenzoate transporter-like MFS transporter
LGGHPVWIAHSARPCSAGGAASAFWLSRISPANDRDVFIVGLGLHGLFVTSVQCLIYSLTAHVYPTAIRARGTAWTLTIGRLGAILSAFLGAAVITAGGSLAYFVTLGIAMLGSTLMLAVLPGRFHPSKAR